MSINIQESNYINSKVKNHHQTIYLNVIEKSICTGEFIVIEGEDNAVFLVLDIKQDIDDQEDKFEVNKWEITVEKLKTDEIRYNYNELVKEVHQTNVCMLINVRQCIGNAYILNNQYLNDTKYANCIGMQHIYQAKHHIDRSGDHFTVSKIMEKHIKFPLEHDTCTNFQLQTKLKVNRTVNKLLSSQSMNQRPQQSNTIQFNVKEWNVIKSELDMKVTEMNGKFTNKILSFDMTMISKRIKVKKEIIRIENKDDIKLFVKCFGINSIFHPRVKYPSVTDGYKVTLNYSETNNQIMAHFVKATKSNDWINIIMEDILETGGKFKYRTGNRGIDLIYLPFNDTLKVTVRYKKLKAGDFRVKNVMMFYLDKAVELDEFKLKIGQLFEFNEILYEIIGNDDENDTEMIRCKVIESNDDMEINSIHQLNLSIVTNKVKAYLS